MMSTMDYDEKRGLTDLRGRLTANTWGGCLFAAFVAVMITGLALLYTVMAGMLAMFIFALFMGG